MSRMVKQALPAEISSAVIISQPDRDILDAAKGGGIIFAGQLLQYGSRFLIAFLMARLLGAEMLGLSNLALSAASITMSVASLGLPAALIRYISIFVSRRDERSVWGVIQIGLGLSAVVSVCAGIGIFFFSAVIAGRLFNQPRLAPLLQMVSVAVPFLVVADAIAAMAQGFKRMDYSVIGNNVAQTIARLLMMVALALLIGLNAKRAIGAFVIATIVSFLVLVYFLNRLFPLRRPLHAAHRPTWEILRFSFPIYFSTLIQTVGGNLQTILLGALGSAAQVGVFAVASQINTIGQMFHSAIATTSSPLVSELHDRGDRMQLGRFYQTATKWTFTANLPLFLIVLLFPSPILAIFGRSFTGGTQALLILAWANIVNTGTGICGTVLDMTGNTSLRLLNSLVTTACTIGLNLWLIPRWGLMGAAVAILSSVAIVNLLRLGEVFALYRLQPYDASFLKPIIAGLIALLVAWGGNRVWPAEASIFALLVNILLLAIVYGGIILLLGLSPEDYMILNRVMRRLKGNLSR